MRRSMSSPPRLIPAAVAALACSLVAMACSDETPKVARVNAVSSTTAASTTTAKASSTTAASTTTASPETTAAAPTDPAATAPGSTAAPAAAPTEPAAPPPTIPSMPADPNAPAPAVVRPPAAWIGFGVPKPGSMFENLRDDHSLDGRGQFVALTFDDGPSQYTQQIVDILRFMGVTATFFQIERQATARPDLVRLMAAAGMHIGSHSKNHPHLRDLSPDAQDDEVVGSIDSLNALVGPGTVKCFRPPYAQYDQHVLDLVATRDVATAMWSVDSQDWKKPAWQSLVTRLVPAIRDRDVLLFHDGGGDRTQTILALPWIIQGLKDRGFQFLPIC